MVPVKAGELPERNSHGSTRAESTHCVDSQVTERRHREVPPYYLRLNRKAEEALVKVPEVLAKVR